MHMLCGAGVAAAGAFISIISFQRAVERGGGSYSVLWGLIVLGFFQFLYGWSTRKPI